MDEQQNVPEAAETSDAAAEAKRKRLDHRGLRTLQELARANNEATEFDPYWQGVADTIEHLLGEPVFEIVEQKTITRTLVRK
jgi:hypothetical protein